MALLNVAKVIGRGIAWAVETMKPSLQDVDDLKKTIEKVITLTRGKPAPPRQRQPLPAPPGDGDSSSNDHNDDDDHDDNHKKKLHWIARAGIIVVVTVGGCYVTAKLLGRGPRGYYLGEHNGLAVALPIDIPDAPPSRFNAVDVTAKSMLLVHPISPSIIGRTDIFVDNLSSFFPSENTSFRYRDIMLLLLISSGLGGRLVRLG